MEHARKVARIRKIVSRRGHYRRRMWHFDSLTRKWMYIYNTTGLKAALPFIRQYSKKAKWYENKLKFFNQKADKDGGAGGNPASE